MPIYGYTCTNKECGKRFDAYIATHKQAECKLTIPNIKFAQCECKSLAVRNMEDIRLCSMVSMAAKLASIMSSPKIPDPGFDGLPTRNLGRDNGLAVRPEIINGTYVDGKRKEGEESYRILNADNIYIRLEGKIGVVECNEDAFLLDDMKHIIGEEIHCDCEFCHPKLVEKKVKESTVNASIGASLFADGIPETLHPDHKSKKRQEKHREQTWAAIDAMAAVDKKREG